MPDNPINVDVTGDDSVAVTGKASKGERTIGVKGIGDSVGVHGKGKTWHGVEGISHSTSGGFGVYGVNTAGGTGVVGESENWHAVYGKSNSKAGGAGVMGEAVGPGIIGKSETWHGVYGETTSTTGGAGVWGEHKGGGAGVVGISQGGEGVHGETNSKTWMAGVTGKAVNPDAIGPGVLGQSVGGPGVFGQGNKDTGVAGFHGDPRLQETTVGSESTKAGVFGASENGAGVLGYSRDKNSPAVFAFGGFRALALDKPLAGWFQGNVQVDGDLFLPGADCAEDFDLAEGELCDPGTVMVIEEGGTVKPCTQAYDKKAAGVVSGAGKFRAGMILDKQSNGKNRLPIALIGKVYCKVDARFAPIELGDTLTTSPTKGHAMKADNPNKAFGAVIGKALHALAEGKGLIPVLVALQ